MFFLLSSLGFAGGGPLNVMVLYNGDSFSSVELALHYAEERQIPSAQLCPIYGFAEDRLYLSWEEYESSVLWALDDCLDAVNDPSLIDYLVLARGLPYRVQLSGGTASLSALLQVFHSGNSQLELAGQPQSNTPAVENPIMIQGDVQAGDYAISNTYEWAYSASTGVVRNEIQPETFKRVAEARSDFYWNMTDNLLIVSRLDGFDFQDAMDLVDRSVAADGLFPQAEFLCMASSDEARGARDPECEFAIRHLQGLGVNAQWLPEFDSSLEGHQVSAYFTGSADLKGSIAGLDYVPGAISCNLTSYGAVPSNFFCDESGETCPASESQTSVARFIRAGASSAHGTVDEPYNTAFPAAGTMLLYAMGYNLGESYFFNQPYLYWRNLLVGDPLTTPFDSRPLIFVDADDGHPHDEIIHISAEHPNGVGRIRVYLYDELVEEVEGGSLNWNTVASSGQELDIFVVAEAADWTLGPTDWPVGETLIRSRTQGWTRIQLTLGDSVPLPETQVKEGGCQYVYGSMDTGVWLIFTLPFLRQKRKNRMRIFGVASGRTKS